MEAKTPWYQSRKLWIAATAALLIAVIVLGGGALGVDKGLIEAALAALAALTSVVLGAHAYTDVRAMESAVDTQRTAAKAENDSVLTSVLPQLLEAVMTSLLSGPPRIAEPVIPEAKLPERPEDSETPEDPSAN